MLKTWTIRRSFIAIALVGFGFVFSGCTGDGGSISGSSGGTSSTASTITITSFQGTSQSSWTIDSSTDGLMTTSPNISIGGFCPRGVVTVKVKIDGTDSGVTSTCNSSQAWSWGKSAVGADGTYTFYVYGVNSFGNDMTDVAYTRKILIDTTAPGTPAITQVHPLSGSAQATSNGSSVTFNNATGTITVSGTTDADVVRMTSTDSTGTFGTQAGGTFSFTTTISAGETRAISFVGYDLLSNGSVAGSITLSFIPPLAASLPYSVLAIKAGTTSNGVTSRALGVGSVGANSRKTSGSYTLDTGFSQTVNVIEQ